MRAVLRLECIADDFFWRKRHRQLTPVEELHYMRRLGSNKSPSFVARLLLGMKREYLQGVRDYSEANSAGSRGIYELYLLADGIYEVNERYKLNKARRYYLRVVGGTMTEISREEAEQWLQQATNAI